MDIANNDRVGKGLAQLKLGLLPFVSNRFITAYRAQGKTGQMVSDLERIVGPTIDPGSPFQDMDVAALLKVMSRSWNDVFWSALGPVERGWVSELRAVRNNWAHQEPFSDENDYRTLDSICRLLTVINSPQAQDAGMLRAEQWRIMTGQLPQPKKAEQTQIPVDPEITPEETALFWVNFDSARTTLHQEGCLTIQGFTGRRKIDPRYGWKYFSSRNAATAALGARKFHACRVCNP